MNREPKIIVLRGNSGSGKTTIAKELQRRFCHGTKPNAGEFLNEVER